jgi:FkbM family methyltransferase
MHYPSFARELMGSAGFDINIGGKRKRLLLATCDRLFVDAKKSTDASIRIGPNILHLNLANPAERLLYYAPHNLLRSYRNSDLYRVISRLAAPFALFVDVGANLGLYSLLARQSGYQTLLFEPEPVHYAFLKRNASVFGTPLDCALSSSCGTTEFFVSGETNPGSSSLVMPEGGWSQSEYQQVVSVRVSTFDTTLSELQLDPSSIRLIKIDVEGNEEQTVRGMAAYLDNPDSAPIWCEVRGPSSGRGRSSAVSVSSFLHTFGYVPYQFHKGEIVPLKLELDRMPQVFDVLFVVPKRHSKSLRLFQ